MGDIPGSVRPFYLAGPGRCDHCLGGHKPTHYPETGAWIHRDSPVLTVNSQGEPIPSPSDAVCNERKLRLVGSLWGDNIIEATAMAATMDADTPARGLDRAGARLAIEGEDPRYIYRIEKGKP